MYGSDRGTGRAHNALLVWTLAQFIRVVFHAKIVTHLVGYSRGDQTDDVRVIGRQAAGELVSTYRTFQSFANNSIGEFLTSKSQIYIQIY